ncbi:hypothetical protein Esti_003827 [Eimeria stiedai]
MPKGALPLGACFTLAAGGGGLGCKLSPPSQAEQQQQQQQQELDLQQLLQTEKMLQQQHQLLVRQQQQHLQQQKRRQRAAAQVCRHLLLPAQQQQQQEGKEEEALLQQAPDCGGFLGLSARGSAAPTALAGGVSSRRAQQESPVSAGQDAAAAAATAAAGAAAAADEGPGLPLSLCCTPTEVPPASHLQGMPTATAKATAAAATAASAAVAAVERSSTPRRGLGSFAFSAVVSPSLTREEGGAAATLGSCNSSRTAQDMGGPPRGLLGALQHKEPLPPPPRPLLHSSKPLHVAAVAATTTSRLQQQQLPPQPYSVAGATSTAAAAAAAGLSSTSCLPLRQLAKTSFSTAAAATATAAGTERLNPLPSPSSSRPLLRGQEAWGLSAAAGGGAAAEATASSSSYSAAFRRQLAETQALRQSALIRIEAANGAVSAAAAAATAARIAAAPPLKAQPKAAAAAEHLMCLQPAAGERDPSKASPFTGAPLSLREPQPLRRSGGLSRKLSLSVSTRTAATAAAADSSCLVGHAGDVLARAGGGDRDRFATPKASNPPPTFPRGTLPSSSNRLWGAAEENAVPHAAAYKPEIRRWRICVEPVSLAAESYREIEQQQQQVGGFPGGSSPAGGLPSLKGPLSQAERSTRAPPAEGPSSPLRHSAPNLSSTVAAGGPLGGLHGASLSQPQPVKQPPQMARPGALKSLLPSTLQQQHMPQQQLPLTAAATAAGEQRFTPVSPERTWSLHVPAACRCSCLDTSSGSSKVRMAKGPTGSLLLELRCCSNCGGFPLASFAYGQMQGSTCKALGLRANDHENK